VAGSAGLAHADTPYRAVGVLAPTGTVIDRLILTDVASYWRVHPSPAKAETGVLAEEPPDNARTVTALLITYAVSHAAGEVPYVVSGYSGLQAASPALEATRLHGAIALGIDLLRAFALILMLAAALSIFIALYNGLSERRYDIAVMRTLGATRADVMSLLVFEGVVLAAAGAVAGLVLGHLLTSALGIALARAQQVPVSGWTWQAEELWIVALALMVGVVSAIVPAWRAHEVDIAATLARG
jgi:putative ABC transport system permease protein